MDERIRCSAGRPRRRLLLPLLLSLGLTGAAPALAGTSGSANQIDTVRLDLHADFGGYASLGAGFRVDIPIVKSGIIATANDELAISPGVDVFFANFNDHYYSGGPYLIPNVVLQWNFYLGDQWSVFPEAGLAFYIGDGEALPRGRAAYAVVDLGLGARYHFNPKRALLMRVSSPTGFQIGLTF